MLDTLLRPDQKKRLISRLILIAIVVGISLLKPKFDQWVSSIAPVDAGNEIVVNDGTELPAERPEILDVHDSAIAEADSGSRANDRFRSDVAAEQPDSRIPASEQSKQNTVADKAKPALGQLRETRNNVFESTAGLVYVPGSADGHRLRHVMKHAKDDTSKPVHGVFDGNGDRDKVFAMIDEAWVKAARGGNDVRKQTQNDRLVYTVRMGQRVGYVGGSEGKRQKNPECNFIRIVVEDDNVVISAYPTKSF